MQKLIWIWNEHYGVRVKSGGYAMHHLLTRELNDDYDTFVRGYAVIFNDKRQVRLCLSEANSAENAFFPEKAFRYFISHYKGYQIIKEEGDPAWIYS